MAARLICLMLPRALAALALLSWPAAAQEGASPGGDSTAARQLESWLQPDPAGPTAPGESFKATTGTVTPDPFAVLTSGALWQETYGELYTRNLGDACSLTCQASDVLYDANDEELSRSEQMGFSFAPAPVLALSANLHGSATDSGIPQAGTTISGATVAAQSHLPWDTVVNIGLNFDHTLADLPDASAAETDSYDAEIEQPLGKLPFTAVFKGRFQNTTVGGAPAGAMPSLEQSLVWKPLTDTTVQMGLRQQQYQEFPGIDHELNEAVFADLSQKMSDGLSWHSYAELLNTKSLYVQAPGANAAQAPVPGANTSLASSIPLSLQDQTLTLSTGPTVQLQKDISASLEYSNRWDKNPTGNGPANEQRVSVSVKGTF